MFRVIVAAAAAARLARAREAAAACPAGARVVIIGASRGAADDFARDIAAAAPATFGLERLTLVQLAARTAMVELARAGRTLATPLAAEAAAARAVFEALGAGSLDYFAPVAATPGFPRAVASTLEELRLTSVPGRALAAAPRAGRDLADLLDRFEAAFDNSATADRAALLRSAAQQLRAAAMQPGTGAWTAGQPGTGISYSLPSRMAVPARGTRHERPATSQGAPRGYQRAESVAWLADLVILLDLPLEHRAERDLALAAIQASRAAVATVPPGDGELEHFFSLHGGVVERIEPAGAGDLSCVQRFLFTREAPAPRPSDGSLEVFSAPGEGRESVEIARRILKEAAAGVPFDQMAIFVRAPQDYFGLLEHALRRAGIPAWFDRGTRRPHPAGRALLALLACAGERLSAARFAEYLSLGQVPSEGPRVGDAVPSRDEALDRTPIPHEGDDAIEARELAAESPTGDEAVIAGTLRAPWKWERFLVDAAVIGGGPDRWARRLDGLDRELQRRIERAVREEGIDDARVQGLERVRQQLANLRAFALPIVATLAGWPERATWGEWLDRLEALVPAVLRTPARVLQVLADLRPMAAVGPVDLDEVRRVLTPRLLALESEPPSRRFGRVLVGTPDQARGRLFRVVFVPGLAERMFPQKPREDPLLVDDVREAVSSELSTHTRRLAAERLRLQLAAGAATERLYVSYPRFELTEARARVPSFYVLDLMRAATGRIPDYERLEAGARERGSATLAWPAPPTPDSAIDDQEHDLAVLRRLLDHPDPAAVRGHAHYLLQLNDCLRRSVVARWSRGAPRWSPADGLIDASPAVAPALAAERLTARPYSVSALQQFSACPYQFLLSAIYRLQPFERPEPLQRLDPLSRGSLFHEMQARLLERLRGERALPVTPASLDRARIVLDEVVGEVAERAHDDLAPAVERVWNDEIASMRRDLHGWLERLAHEGAEWRPAHFELAFGDVPGRRDPASVPEPVLVGGRFRLRGAVDLVEEHRQTRALRVTDHKTGRCPDGIERALVGGGAVLQPVLYAMCVEAAFGRTVTHSRLWYCTSAGGYAVHEVALTDPARAAGIEVLEIIDRAIERGVLVAAPTEEACGRCDFLPVCGPGVFRRIARKPQALLADLHELRSRP